MVGIRQFANGYIKQYSETVTMAIYVFSLANVSLCYLARIIYVEIWEYIWKGKCSTLMVH